MADSTFKCRQCGTWFLFPLRERDKGNKPPCPKCMSLRTFLLFEDD